MAILFRPHGDITRAPRPRDSADRRFLTRLGARLGAEIRIDGGVDYEDWMEPARLLDGFLEMGVETLVLGDAPTHAARRDPLFHIGGAACPDALAGRASRTETGLPRPVWPRPADGVRAARYPHLAAFRRAAGRVLEIADMPGETLEPAEPGSQDPAEVLMRLAGRDILLKQFLPAKAHAPVALRVPDYPDRAELERLLTAAFGMHLLGAHGRRAALLIQERLDLIAEMRFFVFGGSVVTGAGCVEAFTPAQNTAPIDPRLEARRGSGVFLPAGRAALLAARMAAFATDVAADIAAEAPDLAACTLDLAIDTATDAPVAVELNPLENAGLYAADAPRLARAILEAAALASPPVPDRGGARLAP